MAKVYVITAGSYSDYHICAVTLDPEKAKVLEKFYTKHGCEPAGIEEYEADYPYDRIESGCMMYNVWFGPLGEVMKVDSTYATYRESTYGWGGGGVRAEVWAKDEKSAIKIAAERRAVYLAEKEGIT